MRTLIVFDTKHGSTREIADKLARAIGDGTEVFELGKKEPPAIGGYDAVVLGGPVYAGSWSKRAAAFAKSRIPELRAKRFAAFASGFGVEEGPAALKAALPAELVESALALPGLGGKFTLSKMNAVERLIVKAVAKVSSDASSVSEQAIAGLAEAVKGGKR